MAFTVDEGKKSFDWGTVFSILACLFLGGGLFLFIRNNALFSHGARNLLHVEAIIMLGVLGIPFILSLFHLVRHLRRNRKSQTPY